MADNKKVFLWVGVGCGTLFLVVAGSCVGAYFWGKSKLNKAAQEMGVDPSRGGQGIASAMVVKSVELLGFEVKQALPAAEHPGFDKALADTKAKINRIDRPQLDRLSRIIKTYTETVRAERQGGGTPGPEPARKFVKELQAFADSL